MKLSLEDIPNSHNQPYLFFGFKNRNLMADNPTLCTPFAFELQWESAKIKSKKAYKIEAKYCSICSQTARTIAWIF
jgi:hypothetical protein